METSFNSSLGLKPHVFTYSCVLNCISKASRWIAFKDIQILESLSIAGMCSSLSLMVCSFKRKVTFQFLFLLRPIYTLGNFCVTTQCKFCCVLSCDFNIALENTYNQAQFCHHCVTGDLFESWCNLSATKIAMRKSHMYSKQPIKLFIMDPLLGLWLSCGLISGSPPSPPPPPPSQITWLCQEIYELFPLSRRNNFFVC